MPILRGAQHPSHRLTAAEVEEIRATYVPGVISQKALGEQYGVSQQAIAKVLTGQSWRIAEEP